MWISLVTKKGGTADTGSYEMTEIVFAQWLSVEAATRLKAEQEALFVFAVFFFMFSSFAGKEETSHVCCISHLHNRPQINSFMYVLNA